MVRILSMRPDSCAGLLHLHLLLKDQHTVYLDNYEAE